MAVQAFAVGGDAEPDIPNGDEITGHEEIRIAFKAEMKEAANIGGDMKDADADWNVGTDGNSVLVLTPRTLWPRGDNLSLSIKAWTVEDVEVVTELEYSVFYGVCVSGSKGKNNNPGTYLEPFDTIKNALDDVQVRYSAYSEIEVHVDAGDYSVDSTTRVNMVSGISLYGGYSDTWKRDPAANPTNIQDSTSSGGTSVNPNCAVLFDGAGITNATAIDGFNITGGGGDYSAAISVINNAAPSIQNCTITCGTNASAVRHGIYNGLGTSALIQNNTVGNGGGGSVTLCYGIFNDQSTPVIDGNVVNGGNGTSCSAIMNNGNTSNPSIVNNTLTGGNGDYTHGIYNNVSSPDSIYNNVIYVGSGSLESYGIYCVTSTAVIRNNTIICGHSSAAPVSTYCIWMNGAGPTIENNLLVDLKNSVSVGVHENSASADPTAIRNNGFYDLVVLYHDNDDIADRTDIADVNDWSLTTDLVVRPASGNVLGNPLFEDSSSGDFHLTAGSPGAITQGALNGKHSGESWAFSTDKDGGSRSPLDDSSTTGWSMGAYEY